MSMEFSPATNPKRKMEAQDDFPNQRKRARTQQEELVEAAKNFKYSLQPLQGDPQFPYFTIPVDEVLGGQPYSGGMLKLLDLPIPQPTGSSNQAIDVANERRVKLAGLYRSALEVSIRQRSREEMDRVFHARRRAIQHGIDALSPSDAVKSPLNLKAEQDRHPMKIGRPYEETGPPIFLYHPIFSRFKTLVEDPSTTPLPEDVVAAFDLIQAAADTASTEHKRLCLERLLARNLVGAPPKYKCRPSGVLFHEVAAGTVPLLVLEANKAIDADQGDPNVRGAFSYRKLWLSSPVTIRNTCCCPSFILAMTDSKIAVHGGVLADHFIAQPLTEMLGLANFPDYNARAEYIGKVLFALRRCLEELEVFYNDLTPSDEPQVACLSPTFQHYGKDKEATLTYTSGNLLSNRIGRTMFSADARLHGDKWGIPVKVKFTLQYGYEAHALLAKKGLAPQIRHYENLENGWIVVVMDSVAGPDMESGGRVDASPRAIKDIEDAVRTLHEENWVFGDLRRPNIMLCEREAPGGKTEQGAMLVDFDWVGKDGVQRYPWSLNPDFKWAKGMKARGIMKKEHDLGMFELLNLGGSSL